MNDRIVDPGRAPGRGFAERAEARGSPWSNSTPSWQTGSRSCRASRTGSIAYAVLGAHGVDTSRYTFDYVAGWAARAATPSTSITDVIIATGQRVIAAADRILSHTQPVQHLEEQLVDDWELSVQPAPAIAAVKPGWEILAETPPNGLRAERTAGPVAPRPVLGVPR